MAIENPHKHQSQDVVRFLSKGQHSVTDLIKRPSPQIAMGGRVVGGGKG